MPLNYVNLGLVTQNICNLRHIEVMIYLKFYINLRLRGIKAV
jgi:hypothetical protein